MSRRLKAILLTVVYAFSVLAFCSECSFVQIASEETEKEVVSTASEHQGSYSFKLLSKTQVRTVGDAAFDRYSPVSIRYSAVSASVPQYLLHCAFRL